MKQFALFVLLSFSASAADPGMLSLVMPGAKVIAGLSVSQAKSSPFGQFVLSRMQPNEKAFQDFVSATGFDPQRDLTEVLMASEWQQTQSDRWLIVARGSFNPAAFSAAVLKNGGTVTPFQGIGLLNGAPTALAPTNPAWVIAFPDATTALMGDEENVKQAIARFQSHAAPAFNSIAQVNQLSAQYDFWFLTLVPVSQFAGLMPDPTLNQAMSGTLFQSIQQASGGVKFGDNVQFAASAICATEKDAASLVELVKFVGTLLQSNAGKTPQAGQVSALLNSLTASNAAQVVSISLLVPETKIEQILMESKANKKTAKVRAAPVVQ